MAAGRIRSDVRRLWATRQRSRGRYNRAVLAAHYATWREHPTPVHLLAWLLFRRDLGLPLPRRQVPHLRAALPALDVAQRRQALGLLAEAGADADADADAVAGLRASWLDDAAQRLPALAALHVPGTDLATLAREQTRWRADFADAFRAAADADGVQLVGNAASLRGQGLGAQVDEASWVLRFNRFASGPPWTADVGERVTVWVVSPGHEGPVPEAVDWVVVSGPDMLHRLQDWHRLLPLVRSGTPVLTVPLNVWRGCVSVLHAPPSAGVLLLHWLHSLNGPRRWQGIRSAGIGHGPTPRGQAYHLALPGHPPGPRHAWAGEAALVRQWAQEGLRRLDATADGAPAQAGVANG